MRTFIPYLAGFLSVVATLDARADEPQRFPFKDGDRIVMVGDTMIERDQRYGYLETILTLLNPDKSLTFRNLGWSADTVAGISRSGFDPPEAGSQYLVDQILAARPTVLLVGYGMADSFGGESSLSRFVEGLHRLLDAVATTQARVVLLSPIAHANLGSPWPDPAPHNLVLERYTRSIEEVARKRGALFIDLLEPTRDHAGHARISDNGIHLNETGYRFLATRIARKLDPLALEEAPRVELSIGIAVGPIRDAKIARVLPYGIDLGFRLERRTLPIGDLPSTRLMVAVKGLPPGDYELIVHGQHLGRQSADEWAKGVPITVGVDIEQVEALRRSINRKNILFFDRWRPQNITYLLGFRKHEQGNNAIEIPQFDPLVAEQEKEIARLRKPNPHNYELIRVESKLAR